MPAMPDSLRTSVARPERVARERHAAVGRALPRTPLCVPYWTRATYAAMFRCLVSGRVRSGPAAGRLAARLAGLLDVPGVVPCASGRAALQLALRALEVGPGAEVVVPTFCCRSVVPPVLAVGAVPVLADVGGDLNLVAETLAPALTSRTRAVIVAHLFGNPADVEAVVAVCRPRGIAVIDDAAQALGAARNGRPAGGGGDAGILSFGNGKVCFGTGGGALVVPDAALLERVRRIALGPAPGGGAANALGILVWRRWRRWSLPLRRLLSRVVRRPGPPAAGCRAIRDVDAAVALTLLDSLEANLRARRMRAQRYREALGQERAVRLLPHRAGSACLTQVVHVPAGDGGRSGAGSVLGALRASGHEVGGSYVPLHRLPEYARYARGPLETAGSLWEGLVELPCEPSVSLRAVASIAATVRGVL